MVQQTCDCEKPNIQSPNYVQYLLLLGILIVILLIINKKC